MYYLELVAVTCEEDGGEGSEGSTAAPALSKVEVKEYWLRCRLYAEDIELETAAADLTTVELVGVEGVSASMKLHSATRMDPYLLEGLEGLLLSESLALFNGGG